MSRPRVLEAAPWLVFALITSIGAVWYNWHLSNDKADRHARSELLAKLGLPATYPIEWAPLFEGMAVCSVEQGESSAKDGSPMKHWTLKAETEDLPFSEIGDFYQNFYIELGMLQSQMVSIPTGESAEYADDRRVVHIEVETPSSGTKTRLKLDVYEIIDR